MPGTLIDQLQLETSEVYDDTLTMANAESSAVHVEDDLNYIRTQLQVLNGQTNWFDAPTEDMTTLAARAKLEDRDIIRRIRLLTDITVPGGQNYVVLSQASSETPTRPIAIGATTQGAVSAQLAGAVGSHSLDEVAGSSAIWPKNIAIVVDGTTGDPILSGGKQIYALLQVENTATDGNSFNDAADQGQLSFVRINATNDDLEAVPVGDIAGQTINYLYADRIDLDAMNEQDFDPALGFVDAVASVDVTLQNAITNQSGAVTQGAKDIDIQLTDTHEWQFSDGSGNNILNVQAEAAGDAVNVGDGTNAADLNVFGNTTGELSATFDNANQAINIGVTTGRIDSTTLELESTTGDLALDSAAELTFADSRQTTPIPLTDAGNATLTGGPYASLYAAINAAATAGGTTTTIAHTNTTGPIPPNTVAVGPGGNSTQNLADDLLDYTGLDFETEVIIYIDGVLQRPGANAAANNDVYPATNATDITAGGFFAERRIRNNNNVTMITIT
jgi:hypothetical protein